MCSTPMSQLNSLRIGSVDFVSPDQIKVLLDTEAPDNVALNTGTPHEFPRINSYLLVPSDEGHLVAQVEWMTVERAPYPKRKGVEDFGLVDLPFPLRKISLNPLGGLRTEVNETEDQEKYTFKRGVESYPTVGDPVLLPTENQLRAIVESGINRRVKIGSSPMAANAEVKIDPDRLFGRHLAVLGNTGGGKSCTVAGLIRWSLDSAIGHIQNGSNPNARFIILDPNGEYSVAFQDKNAKCYSVEPDSRFKQLKVPLWFWNTAEWCGFTQASPRTQRPTLVQALRSLREGGFKSYDNPSHDMRRFLRTVVSVIKVERNAGKPWSSFPHPKNFLNKILTWRDGGLLDDPSFNGIERDALRKLRNKITEFESAREGSYHYDFSKQEIDDFLNIAHKAHSAFGGCDVDTLPIDADIPREFTGEQLLHSLEANAELLNVSEYVETLLMRIKTLLSDNRMKDISAGSDKITLDEWLHQYIGNDESSNENITIIDLSLIPSEVMHIVTAVIARMILEALQRYRKLNHGEILPTVLVMEEAHNFIKRYNQSDSLDSTTICSQVFERIAREGRKFGLGLTLSSQRPSELSSTVLSQCNSFLLHRISNDQDQQLVHKLVPDHMRGLLRDLPSLPSRHAILLGWASELPVLVNINLLAEHHCPKSKDPDFWDVWTVNKSRQVDWTKIAADWQQYNISYQLFNFCGTIHVDYLFNIFTNHSVYIEKSM